MRIRTFLSTSAFALASMALAGTAAQAQVTAEGAAELEQGIKAFMVETLALPENLSLVFDGGVEVVPDGSTYRLTIPASTLTIEQDYDDRLLVDIGQITADLTPLTDTQYDVTWTLPSEFVIGPEDGFDAVMLTIGGQSGQGVFDTRYSTFLDFALDWQDLQLLPPDDLGRIDVGRVFLLNEAEEVGTEIYTFSGGMGIEDIYFIDNFSGDEVSVAGVGLDAYVEQMDMPAYTSFGMELNEIATALQEAEETGTDPSPLVEQAASLLEGTPVLFNTMELAYWAEGGDFNIDGEAVQFEGGEFVFAVADLASGAGTLTLSYSQGPIQLDPAPPFADALPEGIDIELALTDLPNEAIISNLSAMLRGMLNTGPEAAVMGALFPLQQAAIDAGSRFEVNQFDLVGPSYEVFFEGFVAPSANAPFGAVAQAELVVGRFEQLKAMIQGMIPSPEVGSSIAVLEAAGQITDDGARSYRFEVTEDGRMLLNDADMMPLIEQIAP